MTALIEHLANDRVERGKVVLAYTVGIAAGSLIAAALLFAIS
jgi:hypothetical protein